MTYHTYSNTGICFLNPYRFSDIEDILEDDPSKAAAFFQDLLVNRPTEFSALIRLYMIASRALDLNRVALTNRQGEAIRLAREAAVKGIPPTRYTAQKLGVSSRAVQRLFKRASTRVEENMFAFASEVPISNSNNKRWYPTKAQIKAQIARTPRECAGCGVEIRSGRFTLCLECAKRFGFTREEWSTSKRKGEPAPAHWLLPEARRIDAQVRKEAKNSLFREHGFSGEDFEEALEQYQYAS